jgi:hypothetical protein
MRELGVSTHDLLSVLARPCATGQDARGNTRADGRVRGMPIRIVIARDDPLVVITVFERRERREG